MIQVLLERSQDGLLQSCAACGHADYAPKGFDIVCASVTCLLRTVLAELESKPSVVLQTEIPDRGSLAFSVMNYSKTDMALLMYSFDFLQVGLGRLVQEYPECVQLRVVNN